MNDLSAHMKPPFILRRLSNGFSENLEILVPSYYISPKRPKGLTPVMVRE